jgi:2-amino-4-hydroxy-6-hydroxymethyldihydropteridine diphosphokinase
MFYYLIGLGSNIQPQKHLIDAIRSLNAQIEVDILSYSPALVNPPCGDSFHYEFHNQLVLLQSPLLKASLKEKLEQIELELGREAKTPARKLNDRTIDIDIISAGKTISALFNTPLEEDYNRKLMALWPEAGHLTVSTSL